MSRVPYLDRLGDEFERAVTESPRRQLRGGTVLAIAFVMVLLAGASLWVLRDGRDPDVAETSTTTTTVPENLDSIDAPNVPQTWARVPQDSAFGSGLRTTFSGITTTDNGFAVVATATADDPMATPKAAIIESSDGLEWNVLVEAAGAYLDDIAFGVADLIAVGTRDFRPVAMGADGTMVDLPVLAGSGERAISASAIAATDTGYVVVGHELEANDEQRQRGSIWWSEDGLSWMAVDSPALGWYHEASISDVIVEAGTVLAVGLVGSEPGTSVPMAWLSSNGSEWETIELPAEDDTGFTEVSSLAFGHGRYVAVGSRPSVSGGAGTAWLSEDGRSWTQLTDEALAGADRTATRISAIRPVADGFVAVGHSLERPATHHVIWTTDTSASSWTRLDLADPDDSVSAIAFGIAVDATRVVVTGATFDITYSEASGAVWVGPAPASLEASVPITTAPPEVSERVDNEGSLEVNPERAVAGTSVRVVGRLPDGHGLDEVLVQLESAGSTIDFCRAVAQGRNFMCRVTIADLNPQPDPGTYAVVAAGITDPAETVSIEILAEGSQIIVMDGIYTPTYGPLVQSVTVQNKGGQAIDIGGWLIVNEGRDDPRFEFPEGTTVPAGLSAGLDFRGAFNAFCPEDTDRYFHWCRAVSDSDRIDYYDDGLLWKGGTLQLLDSTGAIVAEWRPGD